MVILNFDVIIYLRCLNFKYLLTEEYRISRYQFEKAAHLRVLAEMERNKALSGMGEEHWDLAFDYLEKYYKALKERVA